MMSSRFAAKVLSVLSALALLALPGTFEVHAQNSPASEQGQSSGTQKQAKVVLTTDPSPAQKGSNTVRVKLTDSAGTPIAGAQVTTTFFMAAMPAMNMPEMKTVIKGADKGDGIYEGKGDLGSAGMWEVTVTAQQNGKTIVTKKLTVKAAGGM